MMPSLKGMKDKKHEDTKDLSHQKIMDIGNAIHSKALEMLEQEKIAAVEKAKNEVWAEAKILYDKALADTLKEAKFGHNLTTVEIDKSRKEAFKSEGARIAETMQENMKAAVDAERKNGEEKLNIAVKETLQKCEAEKSSAVETTKKEEQEIAGNNLDEALRKEKEKTVLALKQKDEEHAAALAQQRRQMEEQSQRAVKEEIAKEKAIASKKAEEVEAEHKKSIKVLEDEIKRKDQAISILLQEKEALLTSKRTVQSELLETREAYQKFINRTTPFEEGYADYVLPPVRTVSSNTQFSLQMAEK